ncbi:hypothetical protein ACHAWO_010118 [Cyclotella atomus]|jgi:hypothetical protein|uniref:Uncharacterized protein n=1 Tax=Cyclotella atomus TaxID=382360 RepID=A0ABD3NC91_9STRA
MALTGNVYESTNDKPSEQQPALTAAVLAEHNDAINNQDESNAELQNEGDATSSQVGAGVLAGVTGLFLGGPILGAVTGASAYYVATSNDGPVGDAARSTGDWAVKTGAKVTEAAKEADEQHHILDKVGSFFSKGWQKVCQFDEEHRASERVKETMSEVGQKTVEFERNHHVFENILIGIRNGIDYLLEKLTGATGRGDGGNHINQSNAPL